MIYSYEELVKQKEEGNKLDFDKITKEQLANLFILENIPNSLIANLYDVSDSKVRAKRRKLDITKNSLDYYNNLYKQFVKKNPTLQLDAKERLLKEENIPAIAKAITHHVFRNGPIEDMHANKQLSQEDMKTLNKYMVNRIAGLLKLAFDNDWLKLEMLFEILKYYGSNWDEVICDTKEIDEIFKIKISNYN